MSYILEALKKLEKEKARARKEVDPVKQLVMLDNAHPPGISSGRSRWIKAAFGICLAMVLIGLTYWTTRYMLLPSNEPGFTLTKAAPVSTPEAPQGPAEPASNQKDESTPGPPRVQTPSSQVGTAPLDKEVSPAQMPPPIGTRKEGTVDDVFPIASLPKGEHQSPASQPDMPERSTVLEGDESGGPEVLDEGPAVGATADGMEGTRAVSVRRPPGSPALKISAIAWSSDTQKRFAVVNLKSVREGDSIEGALVAEIQSEGIVFRWQGSEYKLLMSGH